MTNALLRLALFSGLALGATGLTAQTQFPMSAAPGDYAAPAFGVALAQPVQEGRSAFAAPAAEEPLGKSDEVAPSADDRGAAPGH